MLQRILVWDFPTRIFHWSLALSFIGAYLTAESERWMPIHLTLGYLMAGLIVFRVLWGVMGTAYARFSHFTYRPARVLSYLKSLFSSQPQHYVGHNPAGGVAILLLLGLGALICATGIGYYWEVGGVAWEEPFEALHELAANTMLLVVLVHIAGVVLSSWLHRENLVLSMVHGHKLAAAEAGIPRAYPLLGLVMLLAMIGFAFWYLSGMN